MAQTIFENFQQFFIDIIFMCEVWKCPTHNAVAPLQKSYGGAAISQKCQNSQVHIMYYQTCILWRYINVPRPTDLHQSLPLKISMFTPNSRSRKVTIVITNMIVSDFICLLCEVEVFYELLS